MFDSAPKLSAQAFRACQPHDSAALLLPVVPLEYLREHERNCYFCGHGWECSSMDGDSPTTLPCGHVFGRFCIAAWLNLHGSCPVCFDPAADGPSTETMSSSSSSAAAMAANIESEVSSIPSRLSSLSLSEIAELVPADEVLRLLRLYGGEEAEGDWTYDTCTPGDLPLDTLPPTSFARLEQEKADTSVRVQGQPGKISDADFQAIKKVVYERAARGRDRVFATLLQEKGKDEDMTVENLEHALEIVNRREGTSLSLEELEVALSLVDLASDGRNRTCDILGEYISK